VAVLSLIIVEKRMKKVTTARGVKNRAVGLQVLSSSSAFE